MAKQTLSIKERSAYEIWRSSTAKGKCSTVSAWMAGLEYGRQEAKANAPEMPEDPCEVVVTNLLKEWDRFKAGEVDMLGNEMMPETEDAATVE